MKNRRSTRPWTSAVVLLTVACLALGADAAPKKASPKRILVVSSYDRDVAWSKLTNAGLCDAMREFGYFDGKAQAEEFTRNDFVETPRAVVKKMWMDTKRKSSKGEMDDTSLAIYGYARNFKPDIILLGDDEAVEYVGTKFLDSPIPVIFWGVNITPVKYGLVDSVTRPGHNVTGVYQAGHYVESLRLLKAMAPHAKTFAMLSIESAAGRSHCKTIEYLNRKGALPLRLVATVATNDFELWKAKILELQGKVDAFYLSHYSGMKDASGAAVPAKEAARWYLQNVKIPEAVGFRQCIADGMLCGVDDSGYDQGFRAVVIARDILENGARPETYPPVSPGGGPSVVNAQRARMLGLSVPAGVTVDEYIEKASALGERAP